MRKISLRIEPGPRSGKKMLNYIAQMVPADALHTLNTMVDDAIQH
jgi:hypothetical protein